jgi:hypothetical protein
MNQNGDVMVRVISSSVVGCGLEHRSGQTKSDLLKCSRLWDIKIIFLIYSTSLICRGVAHLWKPHYGSRGIDHMYKPMKMSIEKNMKIELNCFAWYSIPIGRSTSLSYHYIFITQGHSHRISNGVSSDLPRRVISVKGSKWDIWF